MVESRKYLMPGKRSLAGQGGGDTLTGVEIGTDGYTGRD